MLWEILQVLLAIFIILVFSLIIYARWNFGTLERMGVPVEKPHWFFGNVKNLMKEYPHWEDLKRMRRFGNIYGIYEGRTPVVHIADPKVIHKILYTEAEHFEKRAQDLGHPIFNEAIELLKGEKWKVIRNLLSPQFTTGKLKLQSSIAERICNEFMNYLRTKLNSEGRIEKVDIHELAAPLFVEVIAEMLCGIKINDARNPDNQFIKDMRKMMFDEGIKLDGSYRFVLTFPFIMKLMPLMSPEMAIMLRDYVKNVLDAREGSTNENKDMVSVLLEMRRKCHTEKEYAELGITENTVYGQAFEFFLASYLAIVITIKMLTYHLLNNPEVHKKVLEEIDSKLEKHGGEVSYDSVVEMEYLAACFTETMRFSPGFFRPDRICVKEWNHEWLRIPEGMHVVFPLYAIHHNPEIYPEPEKFQPTRFLGENKSTLPSCSYMTFGQGQRQCMGQRMASVLVRIFMVHLLKEFRIEKRPDTIWKEHIGNEISVQLDPIYVDFVKI